MIDDQASAVILFGFSGILFEISRFFGIFWDLWDQKATYMSYQIHQKGN